MEETTISNRPTLRSLLSLLRDAGDAGVLAGDLARQFSEPQVLQARNRWVNTTLEYQRHKAAPTVCRSQAKEKGPYYRGSWQWRWFITSAGLEQLAADPPMTRAQREQARLAARSAYEQNHQRRQALVSSAIAEGFGVSTSHCRRRAKVAELRQAGLSLEDIGHIFGLSRERVRHIEMGRDGPCRCGSCMDTSKVTRVEVINHGAALDFVGTKDIPGRLVATWNCSAEVSLQDGERTLKIFLGAPQAAS